MRDRGSAAANILIVDDDPANLKILEEMLRQEGFEVSAFPRGAPAIIAANSSAGPAALVFQGRKDVGA